MTKSTSQVRCPACGCTSSIDAKTCSMCGADLSQVKPEKPKHAKVLSTSKHQKRIGVFLGVGVLIAAVGIIIALISYLVYSSNLEKEADVARQSEETSLVSREVSVSQDLGNEPGVLLGGGYVCPYSDGAFIANQKGLYYQKTSDLKEKQWTLIATGAFSFLNVYKNTLYAIEASSQNEVAGTKLVSFTFNSSENPKATSPETWMTAPNKAYFTSLECIKEKLYYTETLNGHSELFSKAITEKEEQVKLYDVLDADLQFAGTKSTFSLFVNSYDGTWKLMQSSDSGKTWHEVIHDSNCLGAACLVGSDVYYSTKNGSNYSALKRRSTTGASQEYTSAKNIAEAAGTSSAIALLQGKEGFGWLNPETGMWHDLTEKLPASKGLLTHVSVCGNWIVVFFSDGKVSFVDANGEAESYFAQL